MLALYRRNRLTIEEAEAHLDDINQHTGTLRGLLQALDSQQALAAAYETHLTTAATMLAQLQERVEEMERTDDWDTKRHVVELLVAGIRVQSEGRGRQTKAHVTIRYVFGSPDTTVVSLTKIPTATPTSASTATPS